LWQRQDFPESQNLGCEIENDSFVLAEGGTIGYALVFHKEGPITDEKARHAQFEDDRRARFTGY
jgi:hypothetical protein